MAPGTEETIDDGVEALSDGVRHPPSAPRLGDDRGAVVPEWRPIDEVVVLGRD
jgi:hypothetical protein